MKKTVKVLGALLAVSFMLVIVLFVRANYLYQKTLSLEMSDPVLKIKLSENPHWKKDGERIARMKGCFDCHGSDLGGKTFIQDPALGVFSGSNLTAGNGGVAKNYSQEDWIRAIRYGRGKNKHYLIFMPSEEYSHLTDEDLGKLIAYLKSVPPVDQVLPQPSPGPLAKLLYSFNKMPLLFSGEYIKPEIQSVVQLTPSPTIAYGKYLAASCTGCHHSNFEGGAIPGVPPSWPKAANLTQKGNLRNWKYADFKKTLTTGITPEGKKLNPQYMPWPATAAMNDTELSALFLFLKSLPNTEADTP